MSCFQDHTTQQNHVAMLETGEVNDCDICLLVIYETCGMSSIAATPQPVLTDTLMQTITAHSVA